MGRAIAYTTRMASTLSDGLLLAYRGTDYEVYGDRPFTLRVDRHSTALAMLQQQLQVPCSAYVTACNPLGVPQDADANRALHAGLAATLAQREYRTIEGIGVGRGSTWPGEPSYLVPGMARATAVQLGRELRQNAILWSGTDAVPRLILLR